MLKSYIRLINVALLLSLFSPIIIGVCSYFVNDISHSHPLAFWFALSLIATMQVYLSVRLISTKNLFDFIKSASKDQVAYIDAWTNNSVPFAVLISAALSIFLELMIIRWQGEVFPIFAFYKNYSLLVCFAGLGLGYILAKRNSIPLIFCIPVLVLHFVLLLFLRYGMGGNALALYTMPFSEHLAMGLGSKTDLVHLLSIYFFLSAVFIHIILVFIPIGQLCGRLMTRLESLQAYSFNLIGSLLGVLLSMIVSFFWTPPVIWFICCFVLILLFQKFNNNVLIMGVVASSFGIIALAWPVSLGQEQIHTPYQLLERGPSGKGLTKILAAGHYYQRVHDLSFANANRRTDKSLQRIANYYEFPYRAYGKNIDKVAIVGSGTGNDVAAALRSNVRGVDAIEIDPGILKLGRMYHPESPYADPRVSAMVTDARTFLRTTKNNYDIIVYGLLDSHTLLGHASSIRLDSYVYTVEGLREARQHLKRGGILFL